jgi:hypothetical protein
VLFQVIPTPVSEFWELELSCFGKTEFADVCRYPKFLDDRKYSVKGWTDFRDVIWDEARFVANSKSFCFEKEWNVTAKFTEIDKSIVATENVVAMIPRMDDIESGEVEVLQLLLYFLGIAPWDMRTRDSGIPFCIEKRKFKEFEDVCGFFVRFVYNNFQSMNLWNWKESWNEEVGFRLEE